MNDTLNHPVTRITAIAAASGGKRAFHSVPNQVNAYQTDVESHITSYGAHKRCLVSWNPTSNTVTVRADHVRGQEELPWPDQQQARAAAMHPWQRIHPMGTTLKFASVSDIEAKSEVPGILASRYWTFNVVATRRTAH